MLQSFFMVVGWDVAPFPFAVIAAKIENSAHKLSASNRVVVKLLFTT